MIEITESHQQKTVTTIGESILISGEISGTEDITINGTVEGELHFRDNNILVGESGHIHADVSAKNIVVEGEIKGELRATEQVSIKPTGVVSGDIRAPRVVLDDGCQFKGSVDMDDKHASDHRNPKLQSAGSGEKPAPHPIKGIPHPMKKGKTDKGLMK